MTCCFSAPMIRRHSKKSMKIYTYKNCSSCKKATSWLTARGVEFTQHPIRETAPTVAELGAMLAYYGGDLRKLFNVSGADYRELNMKEQLPQMSESEAFELLSSRGNLVKRPFVLGDGFGYVGFKPELWSERIK